MRIHSQLAWLTFSVTVVALGVMTLIWNSFYTNERRAEVDEQLLHEARLVAALLPSPDSLQSFRAESIIRRIDSEKAVRITIVAPDGRVIAESGLSPDRVVAMDNHGTRPEIQAALRAGVGRSLRYSRTIGVEMSYVAVRWGPTEEPWGTIRAALPATRIRAEQRRGLGRLLQVLGGAVIFAALLGLTSTLVVSRPIGRIARAAHAIAGGRLDLRIDEEGGAEIRDLARSVNHLADSVQKQLAALKSERETLDHLLQEMPDGILALDSEGRITLANRAARTLLGLPEDCAGRKPVEAIRIADLQLAVDRVFRTNEPGTLQLRLTEPEAKRISVTLVPIRGGLVTVLHDVTRLRRLEEARREMVANIGHELRTPLTAVLGYVETMEQSPDLPKAERQRFIEIILRNGRRLQRLVGDLSRLSQLESNPKPIPLLPLQPRELIEGAVETMSPRARDKGVRIEAGPFVELPEVAGDRHGLETVLLNLLDNAVRVSPAGGTIKVGATSADDHVRIEVTDEGPGIPRELKERVFERFYRLDPGRSPEEGGSGLGLAIVKHTVLLHGGTVGVESAPGKGSTFHFTVPKSPPARQEATGGPDPSERA